jgi:hypothetical protein
MIVQHYCKDQASAAYKIYSALKAGHEVSYVQLQELAEFRIFFNSAKASGCTCPSFYPDRHCRHTLAAGLHAGHLEVPADADETPLIVVGPGRRAKAGDRYSKSQPSDLRASLSKFLPSAVSSGSKPKKQSGPSAVSSGSNPKIPSGPSAVSSGSKPKIPSGPEPTTRARQKQSVAVACMVCSGLHIVEECPLVPKDFWKVAKKAAKNELREAHKSAEMVFVSADNAVIHEVAGDGNCLFHSFCQAWGWVGGQGEMLNPIVLRERVVEHILANMDEKYMGLSYKNWIFHTLGSTPADYKANMQGRSAHGLDEDTWGGSLEAGVIARLTGCHIHMFEKVQGGYQRINEALPQEGAGTTRIPQGANHVTIVWTGVHYDSLILKPHQ